MNQAVLQSALHHCKEVTLDIDATEIVSNKTDAQWTYNLFALMSQLLPEELVHHRAMTMRWRLYGIAAKVVKTGRQLFVKLKESYRKLLEQVLTACFGSGSDVDSITV